MDLKRSSRETTYILATQTAKKNSEKCPEIGTIRGIIIKLGIKAPYNIIEKLTRTPKISVLGRDLLETPGSDLEAGVFFPN
jgi:hypothetical protein